MTSYWFYKMAAIASQIYFRFLVWPPATCRKAQSKFHSLAFWLEIAYSRPLKGGFVGLFSQNYVIYRKGGSMQKYFLARKHVVWAIKRENQSNGSTWAQDREKRTWQDRTVKQVTKALYFTYLGRSPHWTHFHKNLHSSCRLRRNHACKRLSWNFQGLRFYRMVTGHFAYETLRLSDTNGVKLKCYYAYVYDVFQKALYKPSCRLEQTVFGVVHYTVSNSVAN